MPNVLTAIFSAATAWGVRLACLLLLLPGSLLAQSRVELISRGAPGQAGNGASGFASRPDVTVSANGRFVVYATLATDLVDGIIDHGNTVDVYLYDRSIGTATLVSHNAASAHRTANGDSRPIGTSADGRWVLYHSAATDLVAGAVDTNSTTDTFLYDRVTNLNVLVSRSAQTAAAGDGASIPVAISADGRWILLQSNASDLVAGSDPWPTTDTFLYDRDSAAIRLVSHTATSTTTAAASDSWPVALSADGRWTLFSTYSRTLVAGVSDGNATADAYLYDRDTGVRILVSHSATSATTTANYWSLAKAMTPDGRTILFESGSTDVISGVIDTNGKGDVYAYDRVDGSSKLISRSAAAAAMTANGQSYAGVFSADGRWVFFSTEATNIVGGVSDGSASLDGYLHDLQSGTAILVTHVAGNVTVAANARPETVTVSEDGRFVLWNSPTTSIDPSVIDGNSGYDAFLFDRMDSDNRALSISAVRPTHTGDQGDSVAVYLSADGRSAICASSAGDLIGDGADRNRSDDVFELIRDSGVNTLISRRTASLPTTANDRPTPRAQSADGRWVLYDSPATNVIDGQIESNGAGGYGSDVFLYDSVGRSTILVSHAAGLPIVTANDGSRGIALSADGRWVLFASSASDLVPGLSDPNGTSSGDIFLFDRDTGVTVLVSHKAGAPTVTANVGSTGVALTPDGRWVLYASEASDLVSGVSDRMFTTDVFVYDRVIGTSALVSHSASLPMTTANGHSGPVAISSDGNYVAFYSAASDLVPGQLDTGNRQNAYLHDRNSETTVLASHVGGVALLAGNGASYPTALSSDGRWLGIQSYATDLLSGLVDSNGSQDAYLFDRLSGTLRLISSSTATANSTADSESVAIAISADGRRVLFESRATDIVAGMVNRNWGLSDVFAYDRDDATSTLISHAAGTPLETGNGIAQATGLSSDGLRVVFHSRSDDLVPSVIDGNAAQDTFVYDFRAHDNQLVSHAAATPNVTAESGSESRGISADGLQVLLYSTSADLDRANLDGNGVEDIYAVRVPPESPLFNTGFE